MRIAAFCVAFAALAGTILAPRPSLAAGALVLSLVLAMFLKLGPWRSLYSVTLGLLLCATSSIPSIAQISYYPRFGALAALAVCTFAGGGARTPFRALPLPGRLLIAGLGLAAAIAATSSIWSVVPVWTAQQSAALATLAAITYSLATRRWAAEPDLIHGDLAVAFWILTMMFGAGIVANLAHAQFTQVYGGRYEGLINNPNMLALLCLLAIPLGWHLYQHSRRILYLAGSIPGVVSLFMAQSRTAILGLGLGLCWLLLRSGAAKSLRFAALSATALLLLFLSGAATTIAASPLATQISARFTDDPGGDALNGRPLAWSEALRLWAQQPALGFGYASGPSLFQHLRQIGQLTFARDVVHNSYLQWLLETGVIGLPALALMLAACGSALVRAASPGLTWLIASGLLLQLTESAMFGTGQAYPFVFWLAVTAACVLPKSRVEPRDADCAATHGLSRR